MFAGTAEYTFLSLASIRLGVKNQLERTSVLESALSNTHVESVAASGFDGADWIWIIAVGFVDAVDDGCGGGNRFILRSQRR